MAKAFYSVVLDRSADSVWDVIRSFGHYTWAGVMGETTIEDGKAGDQVGAIRRFEGGGGSVRQVLLAHSDIDRSYTYAFCDPSALEVRNYVATIRITPVVESGQAFIEWSAEFDCAAEETGHWIHYFEQEGFATWLGALRRFMSEDGARREA
jgi:hypothetical protein